MLKIKFIAIGDEILNGRVQEANGLFLASHLRLYGHSIYSIEIIRDDPQVMFDQINEAYASHELIIISGGLGPTEDDRTKQILANCFEKELGQNDLALKIVKANYLRRGLNWDKSKNSYHLIPQDFLPLDNPKGLAPGLLYQKGTKSVLVAPGVPSEFAAIIKDHLSKVVAQESKEHYSFAIRTKRVPEEKIFSKLCPTLWKDLSAFGYVQSLPQNSGVDIIVSKLLEKNEIAAFEKKIITLVEQTKLKEHIWQFGDLALEAYVIHKARLKNIKISTAESCTGGQLSSLLTDISGSSKVFNGGVISYSNEAKNELLSVSLADVQKHGAVSEQVAIAMAQGALAKFHTDLAVSLTGIAGPTGGSSQKPVGTLYIGIATKQKSFGTLYNFKGDRSYLKNKFCSTALFSLLNELEQIE